MLKSLINLILYWFGAGKIGQAFTQRGGMVHLIQALGLDKLVPRANPDGDYFEMETKGCAFWAC